MTNFIMPSNSCSMIYALKSVPGLADVGVPHGVEDGPRTAAQGSGGVRTKFQISNFTIPNYTYSSMKYALKSVPGLADVGVLHGVGDGSRTPPMSVGTRKRFQMTNLIMPTSVL